MCSGTCRATRRSWDSPGSRSDWRWRSLRGGSGAGDGNRTHVSSLGSYSSTIELHPRRGSQNNTNEMHGTNLLIVMALPQESRGRLERAGANLLYTGVGKVNAAGALARRL